VEATDNQLASRKSFVREWILSLENAGKNKNNRRARVINRAAITDNKEMADRESQQNGGGGGLEVDEASKNGGSQQHIKCVKST
jgi:hypothetical protein